MSSLVLYQKEAQPSPGYEPAKVVTVFKLEDKSLEEALKQVKYGYISWAIPFRELPPTHMLLRACEEAVQSGRGQKLPRATAPKQRSGDPLRLTPPKESV